MSRLTSFLARFFENPFRLDSRSLALLRMGLGVAFLAETLFQIPNIEAFFTNLGVYPLHLYSYLNPPRHFFSLHLAAGGLWWQYILFFCQGLIGLGLIVGFHTRKMAFLAWFFLLSMQNRTLHTLYGGDVLFRVSLFWAMWLPLAENFSFDALRRAGRLPSLKTSLMSLKERNLTVFKTLWHDFWQTGQPKAVFTVATVAYALQMSIYMLDTALHKLEPSWITHFSALENALESSIYRLPPLGDWLLAQKWALKPLTGLTFAIEMLAPLLLLLPFRGGHAKIMGITGYWLVHAGIGLTMSVDLFPLFGFVTILGLLPSRVWSRASQGLLAYKISKKEVIVSVLLLFPLTSVLFYNFADQGGALPEKYYQPLRHMAYSLKLDQRWKMFAPPPGLEVWMTAPAKLRNGEKVDLWRDFRGKNPENMSEEHPNDNYISFPTEKWHKYVVGIVNDSLQQARQRERFADFLCRKWNGKLTKDNVYQDRAQSVSIYYFKRSVWSPNRQADEKIVIVEDFSC